MPSVSNHVAVLEGLKNGTYPTLGVSVGSHQVTPGLHIPKGDTQPTPTLSAPSDLPPGPYTVISLDLDAPFVSWNVMSPIAHWIQTGLHVKQPGQALESDEPAIGPWAAAGPPPGAAPHRYVFFLYSQKPGSQPPPNLTEKPMGLTQRMRFDTEAMVQQLELGAMVAANYFVSN